MKIHVWSPEFSAFGGGIAAAAREAARALVASGHEVEAFGKADTSGWIHGAALRGAGVVPSHVRSVVFAATVAVQAISKRPDCVLCLHVNHGPVARTVQRVRGTNYVIVAHGVEIAASLSASRMRSLRAARRIIAVSAWTTDRLVKLGISSDRVVVIPNTFDDERYAVRPKADALRARYRIASDAPVVVTVSRLSYADAYKGVDRLIQAFRDVRARILDARLLIVGDGDDAARLRRLAESIGVADAVTFSGFVSDAELPDHYRLGEVFALPSTGEGFGIVFLEAMGCGTPVLGGNRDGSVDALEGGKLGLLVDPLRTSDIAGGLIALLQRQGDPTWFDRAALHARVTSAFGRDAYTRRLSAVMSTVH